MILPKDIFKTTKEHIRFLTYLYSEKEFTVSKLSLKFNISKWVIYKRVGYWEKQGYISIVTKVGKKGGKLFKYKLTNKFRKGLRDILVILLKSRGFDKLDIDKIIGKEIV